MGILSNLKKKFKNFFSKAKLTISNNKKKITIGGALSLSALTILLLSLNMYGIILTTSGNIVCGKYCNSTFNISVANYSLCFASDFKLYFDDVSKLDSYTLLNLSNGQPINLAGKCLNIGLHQFQLNGVKKNPTDTVKWGINYGGKNIDPYWYGISEGNPNVIGEVYPSPEIRIESQTYIDQYFNFQFTEINSTHWLAELSFNNQSLLTDL